MTDIKIINEKIETLANAEKITKVVLSELSRELLAYVLIDGKEVDGELVPSFDIQPVNKVLRVLTPMNRRVATMFFTTLLPFKFDDATNSFTKMNKANQVENATLAVEIALTDDAFDIWVWAENNVKIEPKEVDWNKKLTADMVKALEAGLTGDDILNIMNAVLQAASDEEAKGLDQAIAA